MHTADTSGNAAAGHSKPPFDPPVRYQSKNRRFSRLRTLAILTLIPAVALMAFLWRRNNWPRSVTDELGRLRAAGIPVSLHEFDQAYGCSASDSNALAHFQHAFTKLPTNAIPLFRFTTNRGPDALVTDFAPSMRLASPEAQQKAIAYLQSHAEVLRLLHEGLVYESCRFPIQFTDGWNTLLPHGPKCRKAGALLALEAISRARGGDANGAADSISAALHMAEAMNGDPTLLGMVFRDDIATVGCHALRACLDIAPLPGDKLARIARQLRGLVNRDSIRKPLSVERCLLLHTCQSSSVSIARFMNQGGSPGIVVSASLEFMRLKGILQRDCAFGLECFRRVEVKADGPSSRDLADALAGVRDRIADNKGLVKSDVRQVNILTGMIVPGCIRALQQHLLVMGLVDAACVAVGVERYQQRHQQLPSRLEELVPDELAEVPGDPFTGAPFAIRSLDVGYGIAFGDGPTTNMLFAVTRQPGP